MVSALDRKLLRDLWALKTQVLSIALVIACGIGGFIGSLSTHESLVASRDHYYDVARFPDVFATAKRAPLPLAERIRALPGVAELDTRVVRDAQLSMAGVESPMIARLIGTDFEHPPQMSRLTLTGGRWPAPGARAEALVNQRFFEARHLKLGARVNVLMNGRLEPFTLVGTVLSPEFVYATRGGALPDDEWFAVLWTDAKQLASAFDMEGAFDSLELRLQRGAPRQAIIDRVDELLAPFGGLGALGREDQVSNKILTQEIDQQRVFGTVLPTIFLFVAVFILYTVLQRQVYVQRPEIAALKALGYGARPIAWHFLKFACVVVLLGVALGLGLGAWLAGELTRMYTGMFHFPNFAYFVPGPVALAASLAALAGGAGGALAAIRGVVRLKAAEAMRPPAPAQFRPLLIERFGLGRLLTPAQRMVLRSVERKPLRVGVTVAGIAASVAIIIAGTFWSDALDWFMRVQFGQAQRADVTLAFAEPLSHDVRGELERLPGVHAAEVTRTIPARLSAGARSYRTALTGLDEGARLQRILDSDLREAHPVPGGVLLGARLAERLGVRSGDTVRADLLEGKRVSTMLRVAGTVREMAGMSAWMRLSDLNRVAREGDLVSGADLLVDRSQQPRLLAWLKAAPKAAVVVVNRTLLEAFRATSAQNVLFFTAILSLFAATIAVGIVYNSARIQLAERALELASLRVLGFTRREVSVMLLGELALEIAVAIPLGFLAGFGLAALLLALMAHQVLQFPLVIFPPTYLYAGLTVALAGVASALIVRNRIDRLDLVAALKTRE